MKIDHARTYQSPSKMHRLTIPVCIKDAKDNIKNSEASLKKCRTIIKDEADCGHLGFTGELYQMQKQRDRTFHEAESLIADNQAILDYLSNPYNDPVISDAIKNEQEKTLPENLQKANNLFQESAIYHQNIERSISKGAEKLRYLVYPDLTLPVVTKIIKDHIAAIADILKAPEVTEKNKRRIMMFKILQDKYKKNFKKNPPPPPENTTASRAQGDHSRSYIS